MYIFIMGLCTVSSLLLLVDIKKKKNIVLALWIAPLPTGRNLEILFKSNQQIMKDP